MEKRVKYMENKVENKEGQRKRGEVQHTKHKAHSRGSLQGKPSGGTGDIFNWHNVLLLFLGLNKQTLITVEHTALINIISKCTLCANVRQNLLRVFSEL